MEEMCTCTDDISLEGRGKREVMETMVFVPCPKSKHKAHPREEKYPSIRINHVQNRYASSFLVDGVDHGGLP